MQRLLVVAMLAAAGVQAQTQQAAAPTPPSQAASAVKDRLSQGDIAAVVIANKTAITKCVTDQKKKDPALAGTMVVRWTVQPSGRAVGVSVQTALYRPTYFANCVTSLIKTWSFPVSRQGSAPTDVPFTF